MIKFNENHTLNNKKKKSKNNKKKHLKKSNPQPFINNTP